MVHLQQQEQHNRNNYRDKQQYLAIVVAGQNQATTSTSWLQQQVQQSGLVAAMVTVDAAGVKRWLKLQLMQQRVHEGIRSCNYGRKSCR